ncbi:MAG: universal stress family protein [Polyangiaceae bacterium]|jgi:nucleotide-binding universal stress UspA family protein|nr:universal stress family protein [Polyangiaceae bacterium]
MRVLIASDLSEASDEALKQGVEMAGGGPIALCHVMPELGTHALLAQDYEVDVNRQVSLHPRLVEALRGQLSRLVPDAATPDIFIETGSDYDQILHRAEAWGAELIALGTHGRSGLRRWLLGSVADQVVRSAHCPVLVARPSPRGAVLAATDLSEPGLPAIEAAAAEAARLQEKLVVMHAMELPREGDAAMGLLGALPALDTPEVRGQKRALASQIINGALTRLGAKGEIVIAEDDAVDETLQLAGSLPARLIVVGTHGRKGLARVVLGSRSSRILEKAPCSVLVARSVTAAA